MKCYLQNFCIFLGTRLLSSLSLLLSRYGVERKLCNSERKNGEFSAKNVYYKALATKKWINPVDKFRKISSNTWCSQIPCFVVLDTENSNDGKTSLRPSIHPTVRSFVKNASDLIVQPIFSKIDIQLIWMMSRPLEFETDILHGGRGIFYEVPGTFSKF